MRAVAVVLALIVGAAAGPARAGETRCWYDRGAVVVTAAFGGISGDFILDLAAPQSQLHETRAQTEGFETPEVTAPLRLAGESLGLARFKVVDLDARTWDFPVSVNGVIGADVLAGYAVELRFDPCRVTLWKRRAPALAGARRLRLTMIGGAPAVWASIADGRGAARSGWFAVDTGSAGVRLASSAAALSRTPAGIDAASRSHPPARLAALALDDDVLQSLPAGLDPDAAPGLLGAIGDEVWKRYAVRVDLRRQVLELSPPSPSWGGTGREAARVGNSSEAR
ncbi:MAG: hypothetical protein ACHP7N_13175 [Caulobacterales bacterium]